MRNSDYQLFRLKQQLRERKLNREEYVIWRLNFNQREYLENIGYTLIPWIYEINTRRIFNVSYACGLLKEIHYSNLRGKAKIYKKLNITQVKILQNAEVNFRVCKYKIIL